MKNMQWNLARILLLFCAIHFSSCTENQPLHSSWVKTGEDIQWSKSNILTTQLSIDENSKPVKLIAGLRVASGYAYDRLLVRMTQTAPDGKRTITDLDIPVKDAKGEFLGEKGFDIIDIEYEINPNFTFPMIGDYTYTFEQTTPNVDPLHFVMELGVVVR
ncbi:MAG: GldH lipoprotein [Bacteroidota bacterium]